MPGLSWSSAMRSSSPLRPLAHPRLFTRVRGRDILRTSPFGDSRKLNFRFHDFCELRLYGVLGNSPRIHCKFIANG